MPKEIIGIFSPVISQTRDMQVPTYTVTHLEDGLEEKIQIVVRLPGMPYMQIQAAACEKRKSWWLHLSGVSVAK
jgi:hypothetical protein